MPAESRGNLLAQRRGAATGRRRERWPLTGPVAADGVDDGRVMSRSVYDNAGEKCRVTP